MTAIATRSTPVERFLEASDSAGRRRKPDGKGGWDVSCPGPSHDHGDRRMRLHLSEGADGRALVHCHVGCTTDDILHALGLTARDLHADGGRGQVVPLRRRTLPEYLGTVSLAAVAPLPEGPSPATACALDACAQLRRSQKLGDCIAVYDYRDAGGELTGQVHRYDPKGFRPFTRNGSGGWQAKGKITTPYRLPEVREVLAAGGCVVITEGEKDADALYALGLPSMAATCNAGGTGQGWQQSHTQALVDAGAAAGVVVIVGDADAAGQEHVRKVRASLEGAGIVADVQWPTRGKDLAEHLANGGTLADLRPDDAAEVEPSSWEPLDLAAYLDGTHEPEAATLLPRGDGQCLLYPGRLHSFHGESESGKSLVAQAEVSRLLAAGERVLFIDFESDARTVVPRVAAMGAPAAAIRERLRYVRPQEPPTDAAGQAALNVLLSERYALAVIDGLTDALGMFGSSSLDLDEVSRFMRAFPRRIARETGAATVVIDHVTKASDTRGRFAVGSQAKMNALDGAAYVVEVEQPLGLGLRGVVSLRIAKDRPGTVRPSCGTYRKTDRTQLAARVVFDATGDDGRTEVTVEAPTSRVGQESSEADRWRPTGLMERVSDWLATVVEPATVKDIAANVGGSRREYVVAAIDALVSEGFVTVANGGRNRKLHTLARPYRQADDPRSDRYTGHAAGADDDGTEPSGDYGGRAGDYGPCVRCGSNTRRYGPGASPLCGACQDADG